jgi:hypothetical protein
MDDLADFRRTADSGGISRRGLFQPPYDDGERLLARVVHTAVRRVRVDAGKEDLEREGYAGGGSRKLTNEGTVYVTDRRVRLVANLGRVRHEWRWPDLPEVSVIRGFAGVRLIADLDSVECDAILHVANPKFALDPTSLQAATGLLRIEAAWVLATGRNYDEWLADLPRRTTA